MDDTEHMNDSDLFDRLNSLRTSNENVLNK